MEATAAARKGTLWAVGRAVDSWFIVSWSSWGFVMELLNDSRADFAVYRKPKKNTRAELHPPRRAIEAPVLTEDNMLDYKLSQ